jgi:hypothetical protein
MMKPEHLTWQQEIARRLDAATAAVLAIPFGVNTP